MTFDPGAHVHVALFGRGIVREARNGGRYLVDVKGNAMVVTAAQLSAIDEPKRVRREAAPAAFVAGAESPARAHVPASIDLHGHTVAEAEAAVDEFLNDALLAGLAEVRIIHGRSGGRLRAAVHARLRQLSSVREFHMDGSNAGVTIVSL